MKELKRGDTLQVTIEAATVDGTGIARVDGQVVFVPGALPGELCRIRIAHIGRSAVFAELLRVEQPPHLGKYGQSGSTRCGIWTMRWNWNSSARTSIIA